MADHNSKRTTACAAVLFSYLCLLFIRSRGKIMLKEISVKMYSALLEVQYVYRP